MLTYYTLTHTTNPNRSKAAISATALDVHFFFDFFQNVVKNQVIIDHARSNISKQMCQNDFNYITLRILLFVGVYICVINFNEANKLLSMYLNLFGYFQIAITR